MERFVKEFEVQYNRTKQMALGRLSELYHSKTSDVVAYKALAAIDINQEISIGDGVIARKTLHDNNHLVFRTFFQVDGEIAKHEHDCIEMVLLINGSLIDKENDDQLIDKDSPCYIIPPHTPHNIAATGTKAVADVVFKNPETLTSDPLDVITFLASRGFSVDEKYVDKNRLSKMESTP